jgi:hypothetical protein
MKRQVMASKNTTIEVTNPKDSIFSVIIIENVESGKLYC